MSGYDVVGDIHGHADALSHLLETMGYALHNGVYRHPKRVVVFAGDFIDRGPRQREVLSLARAMVEAGAARAVMGNHEFNAIAYATPDGMGGFLRDRSEKNRAQHRIFLEQIGAGSAEHADAIAWFARLPLWLDLGGLRVGGGRACTLWSRLECERSDCRPLALGAPKRWPWRRPPQNEPPKPEPTCQTMRRQ